MFVRLYTIDARSFFLHGVSSSPARFDKSCIFSCLSSLARRAYCGGYFKGSAFNSKSRKTQAKFVFDALCWTRMKGRIVHVSSINSALSPHGLYLTGAAEVLTDGVQQTFEHVPVSRLRSPAHLAHTQLQTEHIQKVIQEWDSVFRAIPQKEVHSFFEPSFTTARWGHFED